MKFPRPLSHYLLLVVLVVIGAIGTIALIKPKASPTDVIGHLKQDKNLHENDVARGMALELWKFNFTLQPGRYYIDSWLEVWDKESSTTDRLSPGKSFIDTEIAGGNLVFSKLDPASRSEEKGKMWRYVIDAQFTHVNGGVSSLGKQMSFIANPLIDEGMTGWHSTQQADIRLGEEVILVTWVSGQTITLSGDHENMRSSNDRSVMLKIKVLPTQGAFK